MLLESEVKMTKLKSIAAADQDPGDAVAFDGGRDESHESLRRKRAGGSALVDNLYYHKVLRPEPQFEQDVKKHTPRFEDSKSTLVGKLDYFYAPYKHSNREAKLLPQYPSTSSMGTSEDWQVADSQNRKKIIARICNNNLADASAPLRAGSKREERKK